MIRRARPDASSDRHRPRFGRWLVLVTALFLLLLAIAIGLVVVLGRSLRDNLNRTPSYTAADYYQNAENQIQNGSYQTAETYLEQALAQKDDPTYRSELAVVKYRLKEYADSVAEYQKLVDQKKGDGFVWNGIGNSYRDWADQDAAQRSQYRAKAEAAYRQAISVDPHYVAAYSNLAILLEAEGRKTEALQVLDQGVAATGDDSLSQVKKALGS